MNNNIYKCNVIQLPQIKDRAGNITFLENLSNVPFEIARVYYLYDVPGGSDRGGHAHKKLHQFIIAVCGSFDVVIDDRLNKRTVHLDRSFYGLYIVPGIWRELLNFSSGAVCLVLASEKYDESDYIREYDEFEKLRRLDKG